MVLRREERSGDNFSIAVAEEFKDNLNRLDLVDLPMTGWIDLD